MVPVTPSEKKKSDTNDLSLMIYSPINILRKYIWEFVLSIIAFSFLVLDSRIFDNIQWVGWCWWIKMDLFFFLVSIIIRFWIFLIQYIMYLIRFSGSYLCCFNLVEYLILCSGYHFFVCLCIAVIRNSLIVLFSMNAYETFLSLSFFLLCS